MQHHISRLALGSLAALLLLGGCTPGRTVTPGPRVVTPMRAVWVTRMDYRSPDDVRTVMENCRTAGFNSVVFQVRGNGTAFYRSKLEPWAEQFDFKDPGFDPLEVACREAKARNLQLHAWVNVMPAWRGTKPPAEPRQLYNAKPEWFWYDQNGNRQALSSFYVSLNPCLPEVRGYIVDVFREIVSGYDVDGLHMDYIRFPNEPPAIPQGSGLDYPRDARTLALYKEATGLDPDQDKDAWDKWRTEQVTQLVADIYGMVRKTRPETVVSASVGTNQRSSAAHFRDEATWVHRGIIDVAFPMNYKRDLASFNEGLEMWMPLKDKLPVVPGLWFDGRLPAAEGAEVARQQIESAVARTGNFCIFSYASLFETRLPDDLTQTTRPEGRGRMSRARETRRDVILPYIASLTTRPAI